MRIFALLVALPLMTTPLAACSIGSDNDSKPGLPAQGSGTTRTFAATDFTAVDLRGSDDVDVRVGTGFSVRAEGPAAQLEKLKIERDGDTLKIGRIDSHGISWGNGGKNDVKVYVTMPRITRGSLTGSGNLTIDRVEGQEFKGDLAGSGNLSVAALSVQTANFDLAGSGDTNIAGTTGKLGVNIAGAGNISARGLKATSADVTIAGSGNVEAEVNGPAKINLLGSGDIDLGKGATCSTSKLGSGTITCGH